MHLTGDRLTVAVATDYGPRIVAFSKVGSAVNALAELDDAAVELPDGRSYRFRGGHRLWAAPEVPETTYEPDDMPVAATETDEGLRVEQSGIGTTGIDKAIVIRLEAGDESVVVTHTLTNSGDRPIEVARWAITQLPVGGTALIPLSRELIDIHGLQADTSIVIWPYTGVNDNPFVMHDRMLVLDADRTEPTKVGTPLDRGWLAYSLNGLVFVKRAKHLPGGRYLDYGASAQIYCDSSFIELETLGQLVSLHPGESTSHWETWELYRIDPGVEPAEIPQLLRLDKRTTP